MKYVSDNNLQRFWTKVKEWIKNNDNSMYGKWVAYTSYSAAANTIVFLGNYKWRVRGASEQIDGAGLCFIAKKGARFSVTFESDHKYVQFGRCNSAGTSSDCIKTGNNRWEYTSKTTNGIYTIPDNAIPDATTFCFIGFSNSSTAVVELLKD